MLSKSLILAAEVGTTQLIVRQTVILDFKHYAHRCKRSFEILGI